MQSKMSGVYIGLFTGEASGLHEGRVWKWGGFRLVGCDELGGSVTRGLLLW